MIITRNMEQIFLDGGLFIGLCSRFTTEPFSNDYKRIALDSNDFEIKRGEYANAKSINFPLTHKAWGLVTHAIVFDSNGGAVGFDFLLDNDGFAVSVIVDRNCVVIFNQGSLRLTFEK